MCAVAWREKLRRATKSVAECIATGLSEGGRGAGARRGQRSSEQQNEAVDELGEKAGVKKRRRCNFERTIKVERAEVISRLPLCAQAESGLQDKG